MSACRHSPCAFLFEGFGGVRGEEVMKKIMLANLCAWILEDRRVTSHHVNPLYACSSTEIPRLFLIMATVFLYFVLGYFPRFFCLIMAAVTQPDQQAGRRGRGWEGMKCYQNRLSLQ